MHLARDLILKKRDGHELSPVELHAFIDGVASGHISDAQIAAFTMATWFRGMSLDEQMNFTLAMRDSGQVMDWPELPGPVLDKHSTGGVGDLVSLVLGPLLAACGAYVPMISGRGLGHSGGTLDKLESIPGFDCHPGTEQFRRLVQANGIAIIGQSDDLVPADRRIYAVRDVTSTVSSNPLIISSILSKKLAEGLDGLVMDIKFGSGAFMGSLEEATGLAGEITRVARRAGLPCNALITDMNQPLARSAGNALEVVEAISVLRGEESDPRLLEVTLALGAELLMLGNLALDMDDALLQASTALDSGAAAESFSRMVAGQGGPVDLLERPQQHLAAAPHVRPVFARGEGFIAAIDTTAVGNVVINLGGGRKLAEDSIDHRVGLSGLAAIGQAIDGKTPIATIHASSQVDWQRAAAALRAAVRLTETAVEPTAVIRDKITGSD